MNTFLNYLKQLPREIEVMIYDRFAELVLTTERRNMMDFFDRRNMCVAIFVKDYIDTYKIYEVGSCDYFYFQNVESEEKYTEVMRYYIFCAEMEKITITIDEFIELFTTLNRAYDDGEWDDVYQTMEEYYERDIFESDHTQEDYDEMVEIYDMFRDVTPDKFIDILTLILDKREC